MSLSTRLDALHLYFRQNRWLWLFTLGTRLLLAFGFIMAGYVKITGERFTDLSCNQPMGHFLQATYDTGYYYTSLGVFQVLAGILLLFPRTVILGVMIYLPIILNITILSYSVRFEGSLFTAPLMVLANLYLLWWNYDRVKYILPLPRRSLPQALPKQKMNNKFPIVFATAVFLTFVAVVVVNINLYELMPRNTIGDCLSQFEGTNRTQAGSSFCDCIHKEGNTLGRCLEAYENAPDDVVPPAESISEK